MFVDDFSKMCELYLILINNDVYIEQIIGEKRNTKLNNSQQKRISEIKKEKSVK